MAGEDWMMKILHTYLQQLEDLRFNVAEVWNPASPDDMAELEEAERAIVEISDEVAQILTEKGCNPRSVYSLADQLTHHDGPVTEFSSAVAEVKACLRSQGEAEPSANEPPRRRNWEEVWDRILSILNENESAINWSQAKVADELGIPPTTFRESSAGEKFRALQDAERQRRSG
jgi:hypothetical protein